LDVGKGLAARPRHDAVLDRFSSACAADQRIAAKMWPAPWSAGGGTKTMLMALFKSLLAHREELRLWLSMLLGPLVTGAGFWFVYKQLKVSADQLRVSNAQANTALRSYRLAVANARRANADARQAQVWKKAEFLANQVKDFFGDETVARMIDMLEWDEREIEFPRRGTVLCFHDEVDAEQARNQEKLRTKFFDKNRYVILSRALQPDDDVSHFTELEAQVRGDLDWFLFRLGQFQHMILSGLFSYKEVEIHLGYVLDLLSGGLDDVSDAIEPAVSKYLEGIQYSAAAALVEVRIAAREDAD
jgi:hypothetical protein